MDDNVKDLLEWIIAAILSAAVLVLFFLITK